MPVHMPSTLDTRRGLMPHIDEACRVHTHDVVQHTPATQRGPALPSRKLTDRHERDTQAPVDTKPGPDRSPKSASKKNYNAPPGAPEIFTAVKTTLTSRSRGPRFHKGVCSPQPGVCQPQPGVLPETLGSVCEA